MQEYEYLDDGGRALCRSHHRLRCDECFYVSELRGQNKRYREEIEFAREELFLALCESKSELEKRHHVKSARHFLLKALEGEEK